MKKLILLLLLFPIFAWAQAPTSDSTILAAPPVSNSVTLQLRYRGGNASNMQIGFYNPIAGKFGQLITGYQFNAYVGAATAAAIAAAGGGYVPTSRLISTGVGLLGGGNLGSNLTLYVDTANITSKTFFNTRIGTADAAALALKELLSNKTATQSSSSTTYPNWLGVTNYVTGVGAGYLQVANNLSDVANTGKSSYNIGGSKLPYKTIEDIRPPEVAPSYISSGLYNNDPVLVQCISGKYLLWYRQGPGHTSGGMVNIRHSADGKTWSSETTVVPYTAGVEHYSVGGGVSPTGRVILTYTERIVSTNIYSAYRIYSDDEGTTWSSPLLLSANADAYGKMIVAGGGLLVQPIYAETPNVLAQIVTSSDNALTWSAPITVTTSPTPGYGNEMSVAYLGSDIIMAIVRDLSGLEFSQFISIDNGSTWSFQGYPTIDASNTKVSPELSVYLSPSGRRMVSLYYADRSYNRIKVITASAIDIINNGITAWQTATIADLTGDLGTPSFGYPSVVHPNNSEFSIGAYHLDHDPITPIAEIHFFTYPASGTQPIVLGNSLFETASYLAAHTITDDLAITYKGWSDVAYINNGTSAQAASFNITGTGQIGSGNTGVKIRSFTGGGYFSLYNASLTPGATNYSLISNGVVTEINGTTNTYLTVSGNPIVTATSSGAAVTGILSATGTFQTGTGATGTLFRPLVGSGSYGAWYSTNITPSASNYTIAATGVDSYFNGTNSAVLNVNNSPIITAISAGAAVTGTVSISSVAHQATPTNFLTQSAIGSGTIQYSTPAETLTAIGAQSAITFGTGVQTALGVNVGTVGSFTVNGGAGGTPSSLVGTNITGLPWGGIISTPTTLAGYGITDTYTNITATSPIFWNSSTKVISSQAASASVSGYVTTGSQTIAGAKTFGSTLTTLSADGGASTGVGLKINDINATYATAGYLQSYQGNIILQAATSGKSLSFWDVSAERMRLASGGALLINTTTDDGVNKLQVNGGAIGTAWKTTGGTSSQLVTGDGSLITALPAGTTQSYSSNNATQTTVSGSIAGSIVCSMPEQGSSYKKVLIYVNTMNGTATYTYPVAFTIAPSTFQGLGGSAGTTIAPNTTSVLVTSAAGFNGFITLEGY